MAGAFIVAAPVLVGIIYSAASALGLTGIGATGLSPARLLRVLSERAVWQSLGWSIWVAAAATALASGAAVMAAVMFRGRTLADRVARGLAVAPLAVPYVVAAAVGLLLLGQSGFLARLFYAAGWIARPGEMPALVYDTWGKGLILTLAWKEFPFLALLAFSLLATRSMALEEVARTLGAGRWSTMVHVTWPILWRGLLPAVTAAFIFVAGSYEAAALLGPSDPLALPVLTLERYEALDLARRADAYVLTLLALLIGLAAVVLHERARIGAELGSE